MQELWLDDWSVQSGSITKMTLRLSDCDPFRKSNHSNILTDITGVCAMWYPPDTHCCHIVWLLVAQVGGLPAVMTVTSEKDFFSQINRGQPSTLLSQVQFYLYCFTQAILPIMWILQTCLWSPGPCFTLPLMVAESMQLLRWYLIKGWFSKEKLCNGKSLRATK